MSQNKKYRKLPRTAPENFETEPFVYRYGRNPLAYLTLEPDKHLFYARTVPGVCGLRIVQKTAVILGDLICAEADLPAFLKEITNYCQDHRLKLIFFNIQEDNLSLYRNAGMHTIKCGEEAWFDLQEYTLRGNKVAKVRAAINYARKHDVTVHEYRPNVNRDPHIDEQIHTISRTWLKNKGGFQMTFSVGDVHLEDPASRRYFYAEREGQVIAFVVYLPYNNGKSYLADVTRRAPDAAQGALEVILYDSWMQLKDEGVESVSLGLAPLANLQKTADTSDHFETMILEKVYTLGRSVYDFQALRHAKKKFNPTVWRNCYYAYSPNIGKLQFLLALALVHLPENKHQATINWIKEKVKR